MYFVLTCSSDAIDGPVARIEYDDDMRSWDNGEAFVDDDGGFPEDGMPAVPVPCSARNARATFKTLYQVPLVLMTVEMVAVLEGLGVDNLQTFPVTLSAKSSRAPTYLAVNIVGRFDPAALPDDAPLVFRNRRASYQIMVHAQVRDALSRFPDLACLRPATAQPISHR